MATQSGIRPGLFVNLGKIVSGERFVGRDNEIRVITQSLANQTNVSVVGMPRVGKSSLVWHVVMHNAGELYSDNRIVSMYIDCSTISTKKEFFLAVVRELQRKIGQMCRKYPDVCPGLDEFVSTDLKRLVDFALADDWYNFSSGYEVLFKVLNEIYEIGVRMIFDEFDKIGNYLKAEDFLTLREASYTPESDLNYIIVSRKPLNEIETQHGGVSNFHGTFSCYIYLNVFSDDDMKAYWARLAEYGLKLTDAERAEILAVSGNHPMFLDICCNYVAENHDTKIVEDTNIRQKLYDEFDQMIKMMTDRGYIDTVKQVVIGPTYNVDKAIVDRLEAMGFLRKVTPKYKADLLFWSNNADESPQRTVYVLFSDYFTRLFYAKYFLDVPYWPLWEEAENSLRDTVHRFLLCRYGENWTGEIQAENSSDYKWCSSLQKVLARYDTNQKVYFNARIKSPIHFSETGELYTLFVKRYWTLWFGKIFDEITERDLPFVNSIAKTNTNWSDIFAFLMQVRRPYAHNNTYVLSNEDITLAKTYCNILIRKIDAKKLSSGQPPKYVAGIVDAGERMENGKEYRGVVVASENDPNVLMVKCDAHKYPLGFADRAAASRFRAGHKVIFRAQASQNRYDPAKIFWQAANVRLAL